MEKELRFDGILYLKLNDGETTDEAEDRLLALLESVGIEPTAYDLSTAED